MSLGDNPAFDEAVDQHHLDMWEPLYESGTVGSDRSSMLSLMEEHGVRVSPENEAVGILQMALDADADLDVDPHPTTATAATGVFAPAGSGRPQTLSGLNSIAPRPVPATTWTTGQKVTLGDDSEAHWEGAAVASVTGEESDDTFAATAHGLEVNDLVVFSSITGGTGLAANTMYRVRTVPNANSFTLKDLAGDSVTFTTDLTAATTATGVYEEGAG